MKSKFLPKVLLLLVSSALLLAACSGGTPTAQGASTQGASTQGATAESTQAPDLSATLSELQGTVEMKNPDQADFSAAADGAHLQVQGLVRTGTDSRVRLDLSTGTIVRVAPESMFTLQSNETQDGSLWTRLLLEAGRVWVILRGGQMEIETPSGVASVRGSYLSVWVDPLTNDVWVTCLEGWCQAENPSAALDMVAGQGASLYYWDPAGTTPPPPPKLRYLSQDDIDQFLSNNPEAQEVMSNIIATASALPSLTPTTESAPVTSCFELGLPANGGEVPINGPIQFDWNDQPETFKYIITITKPSGAELSRITWRSSFQLEPSDLPLAGTYRWSVTAFDSNIQAICTSGPWSFTKPESPTPTPVANCFNLTSPAEGSTLPETGPVTFEWTEQPGRYKYIITFTKPTGEEISLIAWTNDYTKDMELLPEGGTYSWQVTAYDANIQPICSAGPWTFTKTGSSVPTSTPEPNDCVTLLAPADGTNYTGSAKVNFTWTAYPGALKYLIFFKPPGSTPFSFIAWTPAHTRWIESLYLGGTYQWWVTVKNSNLEDVCTSETFSFTKPASQPSGEGLFWNQEGPTGEQGSCSSLGFSVSTNAPADSMVKVVYSTENSQPNGNSDPHIVIGTGPGDFSGDLSLSNEGQEVHWRFATYNGSYTYDTKTYVFTCPNSNEPPEPPQGIEFSNQNGPSGAQSSCASLHFSVSAKAPADAMVKLIYSSSSSPNGNSDPHIVLGTGTGTFSGDLSLPNDGQKVYYRFAVYDGSYTHDSNVSSFTCTKPQKTLTPTDPPGPAFSNQSGPTGTQSSCASLGFSVKTTLSGTIKMVYKKGGGALTASDPYIVIGNGPGPGSGTLTDLASYSGNVSWAFAVYDGNWTFDTKSYSFTCPSAGPQFSGQSGPQGAQASCDSLTFGVTTTLPGMVKLVYSTANSSPAGNNDPHNVIASAGPGSFSATYNTFATFAGQTVYYRFSVYDADYTDDTEVYSFTCPLA